MTEPTQEQRKEFWEGYGFTILLDGHCLYPEDRGISGRVKLLPPIDLTNLDKYVLLKITEKYDIKMFSFYDDLNNKTFWFVHVIDRETNEVEFANIEGCEELKDALFEVSNEVRLAGKEEG